MTRKRVVIAGGGVAGLEAMLALHALASEAVEMYLVAPEPRFWYRPLAVVEPFRLGSVRSFDLSEIASAASTEFLLGEVAAVDGDAHVARTAAGDELEYDILLLACGALPRPVVEGAITFRGPADTELVAGLLRELDSGAVTRVAVAVPLGSVWSLPAYELALLIAAYADSHELPDVHVAVTTPEDQPLNLFGVAARNAVRALLDERGIALHAGVVAVAARAGELRVVPGATLAADRVVALPRLYGPRIEGIPQTRDGFVRVDGHGRVEGFADVYAAGDITSFPVKQGGLAAQQADAAAQEIAARVGAAVGEPQPFRPVLRGLLLTGDAPRYLRHEVGGSSEGSASVEPLWWPPAKIVGRYLAPFLAEVPDLRQATASLEADGHVTVEVALEPAEIARLSRMLVTPPRPAERDEDEPTAAELMSRRLIVVAPEDTLGETAEKMLAQDLGSAVVADWGRVIGILTSRDLLRALAYRTHSSETRVRHWMTADPIVVRPETPASTAVQLMTEHGFHHLPVVEEGHVVGIVGMRDAVRAVVGRARTAPPVGLGF